MPTTACCSIRPAGRAHRRFAASRAGRAARPLESLRHADDWRIDLGARFRDGRLREGRRWRRARCCAGRRRGAGALTGSDCDTRRTALSSIRLTGCPASPMSRQRRRTLEDVPSSPETARRRVTARKLIGKPVIRLDIPAKTDGSARFGLDVRIPGMMYAAITQGPDRRDAQVASTSRNCPPGRVLSKERISSRRSPTAGSPRRSALAAVEIAYTPSAKPAGTVDRGRDEGSARRAPATYRREKRRHAAAALNGRGHRSAPITRCRSSPTPRSNR